MIDRLLQPELLDYRFLTLSFICFLVVGLVFYYIIYKKDGNI